MKRLKRFWNDNRRYYRTEYLLSDHWKQLRGEKLKFNPSCEICGATSLVDVHHKTYGYLYNVTLSDLRTLCRKHHKEEHKRLDEIKHNKFLEKQKERIARKRRIAIKRAMKTTGLSRSVLGHCYDKIYPR